MSQRYEIRVYNGVEPRENASRKWGHLLFKISLLRNGIEVTGIAEASGEARHFVIIQDETVVGMGDIGTKGPYGFVLKERTIIRGESFVKLRLSPAIGDGSMGIARYYFPSKFLVSCSTSTSGEVTKQGILYRFVEWVKSKKRRN